MPTNKGKAEKRAASQEAQGPKAERELEKREAARALGLLAKVEAVGWGGLSARESGRLGGHLARRRRQG